MKNLYALALSVFVSISALAEIRVENVKVGGETYKITFHDERVIVRGPRPEKSYWGPYQFPHPYNLGDRVVVGVHVVNDDIKSFGSDNRWFESRDGGETWGEIKADVTKQCGLLMKNGERLYFPQESGVSLKKYKDEPMKYLTPAYDFSKQAHEGTLPIPDGTSTWIFGTIIRAYNADRLPPSLAKKQWLAMRTPVGKTEPVKEYSQVDWPFLTRVVFQSRGFDKILKPIFPRGDLKLGSDGALWITAFSGEGHINPDTGRYSPYYSAELFRSEDFGRTFKRRGHMEYEADGREFPYQSGGFSDSDIAFMDDGSIVWVLRSAWYAYSGYEWAPMYISRSTDGGRTWTKPRKLDEVGILPRMCKLKCGITLLCYARPGMFVRACDNKTGTKWSDRIMLMTNGDRSSLANVKIEKPTFHDWDGSCNNPELLPIGENTALLFYTDFYYPDTDGVKYKTVLCRKISVEAAR